MVSHKKKILENYHKRLADYNALPMELRMSRKKGESKSASTSKPQYPRLLKDNSMSEDWIVEDSAINVGCVTISHL